MNLLKTGLLVLMLIVLQGCATPAADRDKVVIREPGTRTYGDPQPIGPMARELYVYSAMSANVYHPDSAERASVSPTEQGRDAACARHSREPFPIGTNWRLWEEFPKAGQRLDDDANLRVQLWKHRETDASPIDKLVIVFRGTEARHGQDWLANLRWFVRGRNDHYSLTSHAVAQELQSLIQKELLAGTIAADVTIAATGHSLGGGLAQHMAYSFRAPEHTDLKISKVLAFDPSPVTGWYGVDETLRQRNVEGLAIDRVLERGEALSYVRYVISAIYPPAGKDPAIRGIRFDVSSSLNPLSTHSMRLLACALAKAGVDNAPEPALSAER